MKTKIFKDQIVGKTIKVAVCTPREAMQILESTATPRERRVERYSKKQGCFFFIEDPMKDPDKAECLIWMDDTKTTKSERISMLAEYANYIGEIALGELTTLCPPLLESSLKTGLFMQAQEEEAKLELNDAVTLPLINTEVKVVRECPKMKCNRGNSKVKLGVFEGHRTLWIRDNNLESIFYGAQLLKNLLYRRIEMNVETEEGEIYKSSPKMDSLVLREIFERLVK